ncbi:hypothetical protein SO802_007286 [Lithocarpus litseifolius]|uniref:Uncharacterized protein n=1 Tax=Lithocarpus litseifolius TaxID=425828 RepID=A0AAW2DRG0_9ROSI
MGEAAFEKVQATKRRAERAKVAQDFQRESREVQDSSSIIMGDVWSTTYIVYTRFG